jgi:DNA-binding MarR family transcriptional regulator
MVKNTAKKTSGSTLDLEAFLPYQLKLTPEKVTTESTLELEAFLPYQLSVLSNRISQGIAREYAQRFELGITEWRVLAVLGRYSHLSANEVAERTAMDKVQVSRAVAKLVQVGRVKRATHQADKRRSVLELSAKGRKVYQQIAPLALRFERELIQQLDADEQIWLTRILGKLNMQEFALVDLA